MISSVRHARTLLFASLIIPIALSACQSGTVPKTAHLRTSAEIRRDIGVDGVTSWGHTPSGNSFVSYASADGTTRTRSGNFVDEGNWHIDSSGKLCIKWHKVRNGAETCMTQYVDGHDIYSVLPDGSLASIVTREAPGDSEHL